MRASFRRLGPNSVEQAAREAMFGPAPIFTRLDVVGRREPFWEEADESAAEAPILGHFRTLVECLDGRVDAAPAGLSSRDEGRAESAAIVRWAKNVGVVRVSHGELVPTKKGRALPRRAADLASESADVMASIGPLRLFFDRDSRHLVRQWIDHRWTMLIASIVRNGGSIPKEQLLEELHEQYERCSVEVLARVEFAPAREFQRLDRSLPDATFDADVDQAVRMIELAGLIRREQHGAPFVAMTPFGEGYVWRAVRHEEALAVTGQQMRRSYEARNLLAGGCDVEAGIELLFRILANDGPEALVETLAAAGSTGWQLQWCELVVDSRHDGALPVLEAVADTHPDESVARAARKAAFRRRGAGGRAPAS